MEKKRKGKGKGRKGKILPAHRSISKALLKESSLQKLYEIGFD